MNHHKLPVRRPKYALIEFEKRTAQREKVKGQSKFSAH